MDLAKIKYKHYILKIFRNVQGYKNIQNQA